MTVAHVAVMAAVIAAGHHHHHHHHEAPLPHLPGHLGMYNIPYVPEPWWVDALGLGFVGFVVALLVISLLTSLRR